MKENKSELTELLEFIKHLANYDKDGDVFFCKEANFFELINQAIELNKTQQNKVCYWCKQILRS